MPADDTQTTDDVPASELIQLAQRAANEIAADGSVAKFDEAAP